MSVRRLPLNTVGRDYFVGDIHGCFFELQFKMDSVGFDATKDRIISVGDLVDRGANSLASIDWISRTFFHAVQGNHESMAIRYPRGNMDTDNYFRNGGGWMIALSADQAKEVSEALNTLPMMLEVETKYGLVGVVHAEVAGDDWDWCKANIQDKGVRQQVMWSRDKITLAEQDLIKNIDYVVVGHTPVKKPIRLGNVFYIDTGCCFGGDLTFKTTDELIEGVK